jgi:hypothetical protein
MAIQALNPLRLDRSALHVGQLDRIRGKNPPLSVDTLNRPSAPLGPRSEIVEKCAIFSVRHRNVRSACNAHVDAAG